MKKNIVLITGMSGAGKSSAMNALEDLGYYCIDNFPKELLGQLEELLESKNKYVNIAFSVSALDYVFFMQMFSEIDANVRVIFLDAKDDELLLRYRFTRRLHPMIASGIVTTLEEAIAMERELFERLNIEFDHVIRFDTTKMTQASLGQRIRNRFRVNETTDFKLTFQSFGFKHGVPMDADIVIDARFLPNPFYVESLKNKTGNDLEVYNYVMDDKNTKEFLVYLKNYLDFVFKEYDSQNKAQLVVAVGCTGGQHRSVTICNWLYETYKTLYPCLKSHRDIGVEEQ